ncbi:MAG: hypothetical protein JXR34_13620 [Bacteroidales bacterium]|nr:hypothetical protein [Bacteroidales bacterium]
MLNYLENILSIPSLYRFYKRNSDLQKKFLVETIYVDLGKFQAENDGSLTEKDFKKITDYYAFAIPAFLGEGYCLLRGFGLTKEERYALTYVGSLTGLFDDFFDENPTSLEHIRQLISAVDDTPANNSREKLFWFLSQKALHFTKDKEMLLSFVDKIFEAQILSLKQKTDSLEYAEIERITFEKGGVSMLFYSSVFGQPASDIEYQLRYLLGGMAQLENDIFDIYRDKEQGIKTLATTATKMDDLRIYYTEQTKRIFSLIQQLELPKSNKINFLRFFAYIVSRAFVCFDFLEKNEKLTDDKFLIHNYERKQLVCDMEKMGNQLLHFHHFARICKP